MEKHSSNIEPKLKNKIIANLELIDDEVNELFLEMKEILESLKKTTSETLEILKNNKDS
ncbi:MAG: hypothetical protein KHX03_09860 [Clostridium sp.]|nr:hypothetical protein [Clostridium sp.]